MKSNQFAYHFSNIHMKVKTYLMIYSLLKSLEEIRGDSINSFNNIANANIRGRPVDKNNLRGNEANRIVISSEEKVRFVRVKVVEVNFSVRNFLIDAVE